MLQCIKMAQKFNLNLSCAVNFQIFCDLTLIYQFGLPLSDRVSVTSLKTVPIISFAQEKFGGGRLG